MFRIRPQGIRQLQNQLSDGLEAVADQLLEEARNRAPVETVRDPAFTRDSLHTDKTHSREWPRPAVFVATASGDGFFVHEGTVDTPAYPFLSQALDSLIRQIPSIIRSRTMGGEYGIHRR
jgi:hypothetical protein